MEEPDDSLQPAGTNEDIRTLEGTIDAHAEAARNTRGAVADRLLFGEIKCLEEMISAFDKHPPETDEEEAKFIEEWQTRECLLQHSSSRSALAAILSIDAIEIESIRQTKRFRDMRKKDIEGNPSRGPRNTYCSP